MELMRLAIALAVAALLAAPAVAQSGLDSLIKYQETVTLRVGVGSDYQGRPILRKSSVMCAAGDRMVITGGIVALKFHGSQGPISGQTRFYLEAVDVSGGGNDPVVFWEWEQYHQADTDISVPISAAFTCPNTGKMAFVLHGISWGSWIWVRDVRHTDVGVEDGVTWLEFMLLRGVTSVPPGAGARDRRPRRR